MLFKVRTTFEQSERAWASKGGARPHGLQTWLPSQEDLHHGSLQLVSRGGFLRWPSRTGGETAGLRGRGARGSLPVREEESVVRSCSMFWWCPRSLSLTQKGRSGLRDRVSGRGETAEAAEQAEGQRRATWFGVDLHDVLDKDLLVHLLLLGETDPVRGRGAGDVDDLDDPARVRRRATAVGRVHLLVHGEPRTTGGGGERGRELRVREHVGQGRGNNGEQRAR